MVFVLMADNEPIQHPHPEPIELRRVKPLNIVMFAAAVDPAAQEQAVVKLLEAGYHMDLTEPLERVTAALQSLVVKEA